MAIKVGDIVRAKYGSVVFGFKDTVTGENTHYNILPYGVVVDKESNKQAGEEEFKVKIIFDSTSFAVYKAEDIEVICSTRLINKKTGATLSQIQKEYHKSKVVMGEMLASVPADGLSVEEAFNLYIKALNWAEGDSFYRKTDDRIEEIKEI